MNGAPTPARSYALNAPATSGCAGRTWHVLRGEQVPRTRIGSAEVMREQLLRLTVLFEEHVPGLAIGVIPADAPATTYPGHGFTIYDNTRLATESYHGALTFTDPATIESHQRIFGLLRESALYGYEARELIQRGAKAT
jgi:hypothetical protein